MPPTVPINHYFGLENQQNKTKVLFHYSMLNYSGNNAGFEHSNFFKVNIPSSTEHASEGHPATSRGWGQTDGATRQAVLADPPARHTGDIPTNPTTSFLTAATLIYAIGAGITAAAGTRLALQLLLVKRFKLYSFQLQSLKGLALLFIVTASMCHHWAICAPAAFLGCGRHLSGALSGIEP